MWSKREFVAFRMLRRDFSLRGRPLLFAVSLSDVSFESEGSCIISSVSASCVSFSNVSNSSAACPISGNLLLLHNAYIATDLISILRVAYINIFNQDCDHCAK